MNSKISTLILNLVISERKEHRQRLCDRIIEVIDSQAGSHHGVEGAIIRLLTSKMEACVERPDRNSKDALFAVTEFYSQYYPAYSAEAFSMAA